MGGDYARLMLHAERPKHIRRVTHGLPVGPGPHDQGDEGATGGHLVGSPRSHHPCASVAKGRTS